MAKVPLLTPNPYKESKKKMARKKKSRGHKKGHGKRQSRSFLDNPLRSLKTAGKDTFSDLLETASLLAGAFVTKAAGNAVHGFLPAALLPTPGHAPSIGTNLIEAGVKVGIAEGLGWLAGKTKFTKRFADPITKGGLFLAGWELAAPQILPMLGMPTPGQVQTAQATGAAIQQNGGVGEMPAGQSFHLLGDTVVADRLPAPSYVGETYRRDLSGSSAVASSTSNAPDALQPAWMRSIYDN